ncbi:MAG TPA: phage tail sheath C-terminal domain-containing protein, partial [Candidatus Kapabacteria bacterium]|nr:phage tail sheath C-terminal domain-containing protein [Candidatus Kapabacteria bacterium]
GPVNEPVRVQSFGEYERAFGGLWNDSTMSFAVQQYFNNGGSDAIIVRAYLTNSHDYASIVLTTINPAGPGVAGTLTLTAASKGAWGNNLEVVVDRSAYSDDYSFDLTIQENVGGTIVAREVYYGLTVDATATKYVGRVLDNQSALMKVLDGGLTPSDTGAPASTVLATVVNPHKADDGLALTEAAVKGLATNKSGMYALETADIFNILCFPPLKPLDEAVPGDYSDPDHIHYNDDYSPALWGEAIAYVKKRRAVVIVNPLIAWNTVSEVTDADHGFDTLTKDENAVFYFPNVKAPNPLREFQLETYSPCGIAAGIMARTDSTRGIWKAPAGLDANIRGVQALDVRMTDGENGQLNPLGVNCLRTLPAAGHVIWGARTMKGNDRLASEWKYLPVRRLALYLEESLYRGIQWAVFEPNDEPLWAQLRLNVGAFMHQLFRQGAFQGSSPKDAYFVKCDKETTTQNDINQGIVNVVVGFAPLKPAEFVVLKIQQIAGQIES